MEEIAKRYPYQRTYRQRLEILLKFFEIYILGRKNTNGGLLNKGITATIGRHGAFNMVYFGYYHSVKNYFPAYEVLNRYIIHIQYL